VPAFPPAPREWAQAAPHHHVGEWLSLVEHLVRDQGVGGSNPLSPTNLFSLVVLCFHKRKSLGTIGIVPALRKEREERGTH
jgi:hypothetical protein